MLSLPTEDDQPSTVCKTVTKQPVKCSNHVLTQGVAALRTIQNEFAYIFLTTTNNLIAHYRF